MSNELKDFCFAEFVTGGIKNRNKIYQINEFKLNGIREDCYRSLFLHNEGLKFYVDKTGSVSGYAGKHISDALAFDFDGEDLEAVKEETYKFIMYLYHTFDVPFEYLRIAFSGSKGFHVSIPMNAICDNPQPKEDFYKVYKKIAQELSADFKFVDTSIYESKRLFRMANTINSKSGLYKIPLLYDELDDFSIDEIKELAKKPREIEQLPISEIAVVKPLNELYLKWISINTQTLTPPHNAVKQVKEGQRPKRNEILDLLTDGAVEGNRHSALIRITGALKKKNLDYDFILEILRQWNEKNSPPLNDERLEAESLTVFNDSFISHEQPEIYSLRDAGRKYSEYISQIDHCKVKTGYNSIDNKIRGLMPGETCCILGKTSVGKSAFLQNIGLNYAKSSGEPILFFSMEMPLTSIYERTLQIETGLCGYDIENAVKRNDQDIQIKADLIFNQLPNFYIITKSGLNLEQIEHLILFAEQNIYHRKTGLVLIDYLGLVKSNGKDLYEQTSRVARGMKDLAKELNVPVIYLSQVTKQYNEYDELQINSARDSGSVDEASDFVLALWKEKDKRPETEQTDILQMLGILKNRKGGLGKTRIEMDKRSLKILERMQID